MEEDAELRRRTREEAIEHTDPELVKQLLELESLAEPFQLGFDYDEDTDDIDDRPY